MKSVLTIFGTLLFGVACSGSALPGPVSAGAPSQKSSPPAEKEEQRQAALALALGVCSVRQSLASICDGWLKHRAKKASPLPGDCALLGEVREGDWTAHELLMGQNVWIDEKSVQPKSVSGGAFSAPLADEYTEEWRLLVLQKGESYWPVAESSSYEDGPHGLRGEWSFDFERQYLRVDFRYSSFGADSEEWADSLGVIGLEEQPRQLLHQELNSGESSSYPAESDVRERVQVLALEQDGLHLSARFRTSSEEGGEPVEVKPALIVPFAKRSLGQGARSACYVDEKEEE